MTGNLPPSLDPNPNALQNLKRIAGTRPMVARSSLSISDSDDADDRSVQEEQQSAPFLTSLHERPTIRLASLGASFQLPPGVAERCPTPPPAANLSLATRAASSSLYFSNRKQKRAWHRCFHGPRMQPVVADAFWWALAKFFSVEVDEDLLARIERRLTGQLVAMLDGMQPDAKDLVVDNLHDALAQSVFYMVYGAYPQFRSHLNWQLGVNLANELAGWFHGPIAPLVDIRHWRLVRRPDAKPPTPDSVQDCLDALDDDHLRPSEKLDRLYRHRDHYVNSVIPILTVQSLETFANSKLVAQFAGKAAVKPFRVRMTKSGAPRQPRTEAIFMRNLGLRREREQNRKLREKLDQLHADVAKEVLEGDKAKKQMWKHFRADKREARAVRSEFVAGVVRQIQDDANQGVGVSRLRIVSDAVRSEYGLGPAPSKDW